MTPLTLKTDRLIIRRLHPTDLPRIHRLLDQAFGDGNLVDDDAALSVRAEWMEWTILSD